MKYGVLIVSILMLHAMPSHAGETNVATPSAISDSLSDRLARAAAYFDSNDVTQADAAFQDVIGDPGFSGLPADTRHTAYLYAAWTAIHVDDLPRARDLFQSATNIPSDSPDAWYNLSVIEHDLGNYEPAAAHLLHLLSLWPDTLKHLAHQHITLLVHELDHQSPQRLALLQQLFDLQWSRNDLGADHLWYELALSRIERGEIDAAKAAIDRVHTPVEMIKMRADHRFDAVVDRDSPRFDVLRVATRHAADLRATAMLNPERLDVLMELTYSLLVLDRADEVLTMADAALDLIETAGPQQTMFKSLEDRIWLMNNRAIALRRLHRVDEALDQMIVASTMDEHGEDNVSQALNLGMFYCGLGRPDDAIEVIESAGSMSGYGLMVQTSVKHCAARLKGDDEAADRALEYLRENRKDSQVLYVEALLEADYPDEAASVVIELLGAPDTRAEALFAAQGFLHAEPLPADRTRIERRAALYQRPDVLAALGRVGRVEQHPIHNGSSVR